MRKRNKWIAAGVGLWLTGAVCIGSGVFLDNPGSALTRVVQAATQSETTQGQIDAANKKREQLEQVGKEIRKLYAWNDDAGKSMDEIADAKFSK